MAKYNKILVAVDGSEASKSALTESFKLAFDGKKWLTVVAINPPYQGDLSLVGIGNTGSVLQGPGEKILAEVREIAEANQASIKTRLEEGEPYLKIIEVAEEERCELVVLGRRGKSHLERALMGSVTARVIGHYQGKIIVVPRGSSLGWKNILVAADGSKDSEDAIEEAINYARSYDGSLSVVNAVSVTDEFEALAPGLLDKMIEKAKTYLEALRKKITDAGVKAEIFVRQGEPYKVITDLALQLNADTIVMGTHGRTGITRIFMGSVTARVIGHARCPVLVVK
ncbi:MAG: universal stress protein [Nitrospiraceae bacterium]|nr:MAG: universal stress protein [Nitrospiraceae bacterium]